MRKTRVGVGWIALFIGSTACTAPRAVLHSGRVTPAGDFRVGLSATANISTQTAEALFDGLEHGVKDLAQGNKVTTTEQLNPLVKPLLAYSVDPSGLGYAVFGRYGVMEHLDVGYKLASGTHVLDFMVQFLGPVTAGPDAAAHRWYGSAGLQYSGQTYALPSVAKLDTLQNLLGYEFARKDVLVPVVFSRSLGPDEQYGSLSLGAAYNFSHIAYGFDSRSVGEQLENNGAIHEVPHGAHNIHAIGALANAKLGYRRIFVITSIAAYYQSYGEFPLFGGNKTKLSGVTLVPSMAVQIDI